jgi:hypothetical protein
MDARLRQTRRTGNLLLRKSQLGGFANQPVSLWVELLCAADLFSYRSKLGQRVLAGHSISLKLRALLVAMAPYCLAEQRHLK